MSFKRWPRLKLPGNLESVSQTSVLTRYLILGMIKCCLMLSLARCRPLRCLKKSLWFTVRATYEYHTTSLIWGTCKYHFWRMLSIKLTYFLFFLFEKYDFLRWLLFSSKRWMILSILFVENRPPRWPRYPPQPRYLYQKFHPKLSGNFWPFRVFWPLRFATVRQPCGHPSITFKI